MRRLLILALVATMNSGGLSFSRIRQEYGAAGTIGEIRYWLFFVVLVLLGILAYQQAATRSANRWRVGGKRTWVWIWSVVLLHGYLVLTAFWTADPTEAQRYLVDLLLLTGLLVAAGLVFTRSPERDIGWLLTVQFWISVAFLTGSLLGHWSDDEGLKAFWGGAIGFARIVGTGAIASLYLWIKTRRLSWLIPYPALVLAVVLSGSRASAIALALSSAGLCATVFMIRPELRRGLRQWGAALLVMGFALVWSATPLARAGLQRFWLSMRQLVPNYPVWTNVDLGDRGVLFHEAWSKFLQRPLFGSGLGSFELQIAQETYTYPHNIVLNAAVDGGIVALSFLAISFAMLLPRWFRPLGLEQAAAFSLGGFYLILSIFSGTYYDARLMWIFLLLYLTPVGTQPPHQVRAAAGRSPAYKVYP